MYLNIHFIRKPHTSLEAEFPSIKETTTGSPRSYQGNKNRRAAVRVCKSVNIPGVLSGCETDVLDPDTLRVTEAFCVDCFPLPLT